MSCPSFFRARLLGGTALQEETAGSQGHKVGGRRAVLEVAWPVQNTKHLLCVDWWVFAPPCVFLCPPFFEAEVARGEGAGEAANGTIGPQQRRGRGT